MTDPTIAELFDLTGRTALLSGASGFLGSAFASALAEAGARVLVASRDLATAERVAASLGGREAGNHRGIAMDQTSEASIEAGVAEALKLSDHIDILVNNGHAALGADWSSVTGDQFQEHFRNVTGYFLLARHVRNAAVERGHAASIVMIGSMYGVVGSYPDAYQGVSVASPVAYHALKGGIVHMTRHLAVYWAKDGVRVNTLSPGPFPNEPKCNPEMIRRLITKSPMGRMGKPHELKGALVFLASDASSYVTGQNLLVDGGWTSW